jgi:hypothetical protein
VLSAGSHITCVLTNPSAAILRRRSAGQSIKLYDLLQAKGSSHARSWCIMRPFWHRGSPGTDLHAAVTPQLTHVFTDVQFLRYLALTFASTRLQNGPRSPGDLLSSAGTSGQCFECRLLGCAQSDGGAVILGIWGTLLCSIL